jgi:hypothetical protein
MVELQIVVLAVAGSSPVGHPVHSDYAGPSSLLERRCYFRGVAFSSTRSMAVTPADDGQRSALADAILLQARSGLPPKS